MIWAEQAAVWKRGAVHIGFWCGNLRERDHLKHLGVRENLNGY